MFIVLILHVSHNVSIASALLQTLMSLEFRSNNTEVQNLQLSKGWVYCTQMWVLAFMLSLETNVPNNFRDDKIFTNFSSFNHYSYIFNSLFVIHIFLIVCSHITLFISNRFSDNHWPSVNKTRLHITFNSWNSDGHTV